MDVPTYSVYIAPEQIDERETARVEQAVFWAVARKDGLTSVGGGLCRTHAANILRQLAYKLECQRDSDDCPWP